MNPSIGVVNVLFLVDTVEEMMLLRDLLFHETLHFVIHWAKLDELDNKKFCAGYYQIVIAAQSASNVNTLDGLRREPGTQCRGVIWIGEGHSLEGQNSPAESRDIFISKDGTTQEVLTSSIKTILSNNIGS